MISSLRYNLLKSSRVNFGQISLFFEYLKNWKKFYSTHYFWEGRYSGEFIVWQLRSNQCKWRVNGQTDRRKNGLPLQCYTWHNCWLEEGQGTSTRYQFTWYMNFELFLLYEALWFVFGVTPIHVLSTSWCVDYKSLQLNWKKCTSSFLTSPSSPLPL